MSQKLIPGAQNMEHPTIKHVGHLLQEDRRQELAQVILDLVEENL